MELPEFFRDYFLVSGTLWWGDSTILSPVPLWGWGQGAVQSGYVCITAQSLSLHHGPHLLPRGSFFGEG